jgi:hypothetical protein
MKTLRLGLGTILAWTLVGFQIEWNVEIGLAIQID